MVNTTITSTITWNFDPHSAPSDVALLVAYHVEGSSLVDTATRGRSGWTLGSGRPVPGAVTAWASLPDAPHHFR